MPPLIYGKSPTRKIIFNSENEFYESLGFVCNPNNNIRFVLERNEMQGAWASEGRLQFTLNRIYPNYFSDNFTAGVGLVLHRINNTEYCDYLKANHAIIDGAVQNITAVRATIPTQFQNDFDRGFTM